MCRDRGSMTIWAAALAGLILLGSSGALLYGSAVEGRHRAETAADLAALAAAVHVVDGPASACAIETPASTAPVSSNVSASGSTGGIDSKSSRSSAKPAGWGSGGRIAVGNGGSLRGCEVVGDEVEVVVSRRVSLGGLGTFTTVARARAGPVEPGAFG